MSLVNVRERILEAATRDFARSGLSGARVDAIARGAQTSKERLYAHFANKEELFLAVLDRNLDALGAAVVLADDLPAFAAALTRHAFAHPDELRLMEWARLHGGEISENYARQHEQRMRVYRDAIADDQRNGLVDGAWAADDILTFVFGLALSWARDPGRPDDAITAPEDTIAARAERVRLAVATLFVRRDG